MLTSLDQINIQIVYGIKVLPNGDPYIATAEKAAASLTLVAVPGAFLVNTLPICASHSPLMFVFDQALLVKYLPEWFPGAGFQKQARLWREHAVKMNAAPFEAVKQALVS